MVSASSANSTPRNWSYPVPSEQSWGPSVWVRPSTLGNNKLSRWGAAIRGPSAASMKYIHVESQKNKQHDKKMAEDPGSQAAEVVEAVKTVDAAKQLFDDYLERKCTFKELKKVMDGMDLNGNFDNAKVNAFQLNSYCEKGIITEAVK